MHKRPKLLLVGDKAIVIEYGDEISEECNDKVLNLHNILRTEKINGVTGLIPTFRSLLIKYNPLKVNFQELVKTINKYTDCENNSRKYMPKIIEIPVLYGGEFGPDLTFVAKYNNISCEEVIKIHTGPLYRIYMLGFLMGFPYLGNIPDRITAPRLDEPKIKIRAGSVGIAGNQTGIYPVDSPGGWRIIGATPVKLYDHQREKPILLEAGHYLRFVQINEKKFNDIKESVETGKYLIKVEDYIKQIRGFK
ncbi:MAG TPA: 5-oxoprolinase subunit PxpB [Thermoanaerobacterales bacterium]|nr:5-oxoprolinase subunit PxpB [Thermoanaerobacterales bacterium]